MARFFPKGLVPQFLSLDISELISCRQILIMFQALDSSSLSISMLLEALIYIKNENTEISYEAKLPDITRKDLLSLSKLNANVGIEL